MRFYCLDTNVFIEPWNKYYSMKRCPEYWDILDNLGKKGTVFCPDQVKREIDKVDDLLKQWLNTKPYFIRQETEDVQLRVREILKAFPNLIMVGANRSMADPWVVAHAMVVNAVVVSKEYGINQDQNNSRIKIPDVCRHFKINCISDFEFIDEIGIKFKASLNEK
ncbi:DUF4411 family protein [Candidatus Poribacteria bacterium]|nr:DUF4411 family protein [Candidatus Poribacteria bacterium]